MTNSIHRRRVAMKNKAWTPVAEALPQREGYYKVKFANGQEDEKPFRTRPRQNIKGFMTEEEVTHWK